MAGVRRYLDRRAGPRRDGRGPAAAGCARLRAQRPGAAGHALNSTGFGAGDAAYLQAVGRYDAVTPESALKLAELQPSRGRYAFSEGDRMVDWAHARGKPMHGTTLIWCYDSVLPSWLLSRSWTRSELIAVMQDHI